MELEENKIKEEATSIVDIKHGRFKELSWYDPNFDLIVGGVGGIGSWLSFLLARAGYRLYLFDDDIIDESNMAGQLYQIKNIGMSKAAAMQANILDFSDNSKIELLGRYEKDSETCPITFSCFDNMAARKMLFENWRKQKDRSIFIDGRMLAEGFQIYSVVAGREEAYVETLFDDSEVGEQPCSAKATSHCAAIISGIMMGIFTNHQANIKLNLYHRDVPFLTIFEIPLITLKTK